MFASKRVVTHSLVMLPYLIVTLANLHKSHQVAYRASLWHVFLHAAAMWTSSVSEFEMSSKDEVSSSPEPFSSPVFPKKTMSEEPERYHSRPLESPQDDPVSDSDLAGLELPKLDTLESEVCRLDLKPLE